MCDNPPCLPSGTEIVTDFSRLLNWYEYVIFGAVLALSMAIGVFYGCFGTKNKTNEEFLMASRQMSILPVSFFNVDSESDENIFLIAYPFRLHYRWSVVSYQQVRVSYPRISGTCSVILTFSF